MLTFMVSHRALHSAYRAARAIAVECGGVTFVQIGLALPVLLGFTGLGMDVAVWQFEKRAMQTAIDSAALSAAHALSSGADQTELEQAVNKSFNDSEFTLEGSDVLVIRTPPQNGGYAGDSKAVELVLTRTADMFFSRLVVSDATQIAARGVAGTVGVGTHCILALDEAADSAVEFTGNADADINCGVASNSRSDRAIHVGGKARLKADPAQAFGDIFVEGKATLETNQPPQPNSPRVHDPFGPDGRDLQMPLTGSCEPAPDLSGPSGTVTLDPGHYCGDLIIENKNVHFNPGTYIIDNGDFRIKAGSQVTGTDVTFILTGFPASDVGTLEMTSNSDVDLSAPSTGDFAGVLFFEDPEAASFNGTDPYQHTILGGADTHLNGAIYTPGREIVFTGGATASGQCLQLVARKVTVTGNTVIDNDPSICGDLGLDQILQTRIRLLE